ncbi:unnamed protein product [Cylindrotheca closterium]|uniref:RBR-type E3 ubiquitin transferase n=1 Tax=Cylindrotheca closterium TaxID=2856 RepID=A0AAD2G9U3_9STRA|nr:unnamed protein product [Cylindrotheca closterium]
MELSHAERPPPSTWTATDVQQWAVDMRLAQEAVVGLSENQIDGATLITLSKSELREDLGIKSLAARRHLLDLIRSLQIQNETSDFSAAMDVHDEEIRRFAAIQVSNNSAGADAAAIGHTVNMINPTHLAIAHELDSDAQRQRQVISDHLLACRIQRDLQRGLPAYEDAQTAHEEQQRLNALFQREEQDYIYAESLATGRERAHVQSRRQRETAEPQPIPPAAVVGGNERAIPSTASRVATLFGLSMKVCADNKVNVAQAFSTGKVKPITTPALVSDDDDDDDNDNDGGGGVKYRYHNKNTQEDKRKPAPMPKGLHNLPFVDQCSVCFDKNVKGYHLACEHRQCIPCTRRLFKTGLKDNTLLPLRCCEVPIDMSIAKDLLKEKEANLILQRVEELGAANKMYCPTCNSFLNLDLVDASQSVTVQCSCKTHLCVACKTTAHPGISCRQHQRQRLNDSSDDGRALFLALSRDKGWKQCPKCSEMIELRSGCNHMTCANCRHEFCYKCLEKWSTGNGQCTSGRCELWDENRLLEAGEARVQQEEQARGEAIAGPARQERLRVAVAGLRQNEICAHNWVRSGGYKGLCPNCSFEMFAYGMRCSSDCGSTVCYTCAHHRIPQRGWR